MKKGFTLIELLAVIVILAIIALIATPIILNIIDQARKGAFKDSAYGIIKAAELSYTQSILNGDNGHTIYTYMDGAESSEPSGRILNYKGEKPNNGIIAVNTDGKVAIAIHNGTYCAIKGYTDVIITLSDQNVDQCKISTAPPSANADISGAPAPELTTGMIPVKWDGTDWVKADLTNKTGNNQWYDYNAKIWANAVTVTNANRSTYESAAAGTIITMDIINTMWVWIPRYKYAIPSGSGPREINIVFEAKDVTKSKGTAVDIDYLTHPVFTFGTTEVSGIWVGKFETTGNISSPTIVPNKSSIRNQSVSAMYNSARLMEDNTNYGFSTNSDIHMMKNSEWGAVAYLSHSKYGKNNEVWINNSDAYITGCAGDSASASGYSGCQHEYNTTTGVNASTTGNIYGVYDMSGGAEEYVMANYNNLSVSSGFSNVSTIPDEYINRYTTEYASTACNGGICYGDALTETSNWYTDSANSVFSGYPWQHRGGFYSSSTYAGIFSYSRINGGAFNNYSFRLSQVKI